MEKLSLKITVGVENSHGADFVVGRIAEHVSDGQHFDPTDKLARLRGASWSVPVLSIERADGRPFGLETEFDQYWDDTHCDGDEGEPGERAALRDAFFEGYRARERRG